MTQTHADRPPFMKTHTLDAPGVVLHYDVRPGDSAAEPPLLMFGSPMAASGFVTLASHFQDQTTVTYDPRGADRSKRTDGALVTTPDEHADDLHRLIDALGAGPVDIFATSGGAVNALVLVAKHPEQIRMLVTHEPPVAEVLPDREALLVAANDIHDTYVRAGFGPAMAKFIALVGYQGEFPAGFDAWPEPAAFGLPSGDDGPRVDPLLGLNMPSCLEYHHDFEAIRRGPARVVMVRGEDSGDQMAARAASAVAAELGITPAMFPGAHDGFLGGEYGGMGKPDEFAAALREVLVA
jgi:pimeloyl-ACP methyl ester carboxylesterase